MTIAEVLVLAEEHQPDVMTKIASIVDELQETAPFVLDEVFQEFREVAEVVGQKTKGASVADWAKGVGRGAATAAATGVLTGLGISVATDLFSAAKRGFSKGKNWDRIMKANPTLHEEVEFPARLPAAFNTLHRLAPDLSADPLMAGSALRMLANVPEHNLLGTAKQVVDLHMGIAKSRAEPFSPSGVKVEQREEHRHSHNYPRAPGATATNHPRRP